jgi:hypothetical protein
VSKYTQRRAELVKSLDLSETYQRDHSPTGVMRRRIRINPETGEPEVLPEPVREEKPKMRPEDQRRGNLQPGGRRPKGA